MFVNKHFIYLGYGSKSKCCYNAKPSAYYFHVKTKISVDFQISISVPLKEVSIVFGETFLTLVCSKSHKYHDIDMKFYSRKMR